MATSKDPEITKLQAAVARLEKVTAALHARLISLEKENKRLRGAVGRANDQIGVIERRAMTQRLPRG